MNYKNKPTQEQRILDLLRERGAYIYEFVASRPSGLGIAQYNARILGLRRKGHDIECIKSGHYVLHPKDPAVAFTGEL